MQNQTALVTGGMGGIGTVIARYLADEGARVAVTYNKKGNHELARQWQAEQKAQGYNFAIFYVDLTDFAVVSKMVEEVTAYLGRIDILVNNAGITADTTLLKMAPDQWHDVINNNLNSLFNVTHNVLKEMIKNQYGRIINISSINGQKGQFGQTNYCASKAGIHGFTKALAYEVAKKGITVNTISPGYVKTPMVDKVDPTILEGIIKQIPVGRLAEPQEIARAGTFLVSRQSSYIPGSNFSINGGQYMQ
ncbi:MAG TPA: beta-ketoacyl-ACP reductase [Gammaproteobacteria bacterium]|nr:beta-ketoacyl-ACP reductase [Gammaproteobacteria bacterium]